MKQLITINDKSYNFNYTLKSVTNLPLIDGIEIIGVQIPNFCYNPELSIAGNCRMCFIESKNALKPVISCAVNLKSYLNSEIFTESPLVFKSRESILEFLLLNHPIDCTICDQAGECDLQDHSLIHGVSNKRFYSYKRTVDDKYVGPIIITAMTRCIHCTRCIRFCSEIAGLKEFGIFGRGVSSEIGIYKLTGQLTSELSGNLIDLCPVGALTGRPYPFTTRVWEHHYKTSIDFTDAFGQEVNVGIAYNKIKRILPSLSINEEDTPWINDRTRFAFEGLPFISTLKPLFYKKKTEKKINNKIIQNLVLLIYFFDHLNNHALKFCSFLIIFGTSTSLELISLLLLTFFKYSFLQIKTSEVLIQQNDLELNFQLNNSTGNLVNLLKSDLCLLIGVNTRYEGSHLNLKLRKRYLKSDFNIISLSSLMDLTFPTHIIGSTTKILNSIIEGNSLLNQLFKNSRYPMLILNPHYFKRFNSKNYEIFISMLQSYTCFFVKKWNGLNILSSSLNDVGTNTLGRFPIIKPTDVVTSSTVYFFNTPLYIFSIKKFFELKILNFLNFKNDLNETQTATSSLFFNLQSNNTSLLSPLIYQNPVITNNTWVIKKLKENNMSHKIFPILSKNFYTNIETFLNSEGIIKKSSNVIASNSNLKNDWKFFRRVFKHLKKNIIFTKDIKNNKRTIFDSNNIVKFKNYLFLHLFPIKVFTRLLFYQLLENKTFVNKKNSFFFILNKNFNSKIIFWLQDFYLNNRDLYSRHSKTMTKCSLYIRSNKLTFF